LLRTGAAHRGEATVVLHDPGVRVSPAVTIARDE
jgi:hypothetical protein